VKIQTLNIAAARSTLEPREAKLQAALLKRLHARGWLAMRVNSGAFKTERGDFFRAYLVTGAPDESAGFPDVLAMRGRRGCSIELRLFEVKRRGAKRTPEQRRFADFALSRGISVEVVRGAAGLESLEL
jgi:Holliday junction resolvase